MRLSALAGLFKGTNRAGESESSALKEQLEQVTTALRQLQRDYADLKSARDVLYGTFPKDELDDPLEAEFSSVMFAGRAIKKLLSDYEFDTVLDIGSGAGEQAAVFLRHGKRVTAVDYGQSPYFALHDPAIETVTGDFLALDLGTQFDCAWASHVLEHQPDPHRFLRKVHAVTREHGVVAITVPPLKHQIVGGHVSLWNAGLLLYHLVIAGFDCSRAGVLRYGYNISIIVQKETIEVPALGFDQGDIRRLRPFLPAGLEYQPNEMDDPFNGDIRRLNW